MADVEEVGDSSLDVLRSVQREAKELLRIALQCSVGAERLVGGASGGEAELPLLVRLKRCDHSTTNQGSLAPTVSTSAGRSKVYSGNSSMLKWSCTYVSI